ncbi:MAG TPA: hypothetical protein VFV38_41340 [Ktedonobacteraceae bacterium]|nr:hypothetical protein [Ktedonobacteraceae bacterium]
MFIVFFVVQVALSPATGAGDIDSVQVSGTVPVRKHRGPMPDAADLVLNSSTASTGRALYERLPGRAVFTHFACGADQAKLDMLAVVGMGRECF